MKDLEINHLSIFEKIRLYFICLYSEHKYLEILITNRNYEDDDYRWIGHMLWVRKQERKQIIKSIFNQK